MKLLVDNLTYILLQRHDIEPEQAEWMRYALLRRLTSLVTFLILLPVGMLLVGLIRATLFIFTFRFLRTRTGGYHARTAIGCFAASLSTMLISLVIARNVSSCGVSVGVFLVALSLIWVLAPANNIYLHLSKDEISAIRSKLKIRIVIVFSLGCALLPLNICSANCVIGATASVGIMLLLSAIGFGIQ